MNASKHALSIWCQYCRLVAFAVTAAGRRMVRLRRGANKRAAEQVPAGTLWMKPTEQPDAEDSGVTASLVSVF